MTRKNERETTMRRLYTTAIRQLFAYHRIPAFADAAADLIVKSASIPPSDGPLTEEQVMTFLDDTRQALKDALLHRLEDGKPLVTPAPTKKP
jgi:integrase